MRFPIFLGLALAAVSTVAPAQQSEVPLWLNLASTQGLMGASFSYRFTHRFQEPARNNSKDAFGLDGYSFSGLGLDFAVPSTPGTNFQIYRTPDNKTFTIALHQVLVSRPDYRAAIRIERFDETIKDQDFTPNSREGIVGTSVQLPLSWSGGGFTLLVVPTYLSSTSTQRKGVTTAGAGIRWDMAERHSLIGEYYPRPSKVKDLKVFVDSTTTREAENGWALGYVFRTKGHRFTLLATNVRGTTPNQVLSGDYAGTGPNRSGEWSLGFNLVRIF
ncbi:MAG: hypothetical protein IPQ13_14675 [Holophagaceae bacterium]|nr:hypothetical protein [Holophagaceae bacterium]